MTNLSTEDQTLLRDSADRFFVEQMPITSLRKLRDEKDPIGFDRELWKAIAEMGWAGILIDENHDGVELGYENLGIILESSGRTLAATPLLSTALLGAQILQSAGSAEQQSRYLPAISAGELIIGVAIDEYRKHRPARIETTAAATGSSYQLNGTKTFVLDGHVADRILVLARTDGEPSAEHGLTFFDVDPQAAGVNIDRLHMVDGRNLAVLNFHNVRCSEQDIVGQLHAAHPIADLALDCVRAGLAAEMLGAMTEAFERTLEYLRVRTQFDVPIGSFQALKHRAAAIFCEIELTRSAVYAALSSLDEINVGDERNEAARLCSLAKAKASSIFELVSNEAVQMHGGIGMTDAEEIGFFLKRARVAQHTFGDALFHRDRWARLSGF